jgi:hypothetical protein
MLPTQFLTEQLLLEHSKRQALRLVKWIGQDPERLGALLEIFLGDNYRLSQRAAWVLSLFADRSPQLMHLCLPQMVAKMREPGVHDAVKRNVVRVFQEIEIPDDLLDELADACFGFLADSQEAVAVRVFSMTVLENICEKIPELKPELRLLLEEHLPHGSTGFKNRGQKILKRLQAIN